MSDDDANSPTVREAIIRLEAKIDVVLGQHEVKLEELTRRQRETSEELREHDSRINGNALAIAETRAQAGSAQADVQALRTDVAKDIADVERRVNDAKPKNVATWAAVVVAGLTIVLTPILTALMTRR